MMQKLKFKIKGMHCQSCALLIEEKLKNLKGVIRPKINFESHLGVVVYNNKVIKEQIIIKEINKAGNYQIEVIRETPEKNEKNTIPEKQNLSLETKQTSQMLKIIIILIIILLGLNFYLSIRLSKQESLKKSSTKDSGQVQGIAEKPKTPSLPTEQPAAKQSFTITQNNHLRGDFNAPITLVEFSDFECPFCARFYPTVNKILSDYQGKVRVVYKHFPLPFHPNSQKAAEASECADEQGKFWQYHDKLFENQAGGYSLDKFKTWAGDLGLNEAKFNACLDSGKFAQKVKDDYQEGGQKGVSGTPATFVNGQLVSGALPYESFKQIIDKLLTQ